jgi:hypothetical protein
MIFITVTRPPYGTYPASSMDIRGDHILQMQPDTKGRGTWLTVRFIGAVIVAETPDEIKSEIRREIARSGVAPDDET